MRRSALLFPIPAALILVLAVTGAIARAQEPGEKIVFTRRAPVVSKLWPKLKIK